MRRLSLARIWTPRFYDRLARYYDRLKWLVSPLGEKAQRRVVRDLHSGLILDVGCGTGTLLTLAHANGLKCFGIDTSSGMLGRARAKVPAAEYHRASYYSIPYAGGCFDLVVETYALGGVEIDAKKALSEMLRVCKSGGQVRIADYAAPLGETWSQRLLRQAAILAGDMPHDYGRMFRELGYEPEVEILGGNDMYQFFCVEKAP